MELYDMLRQVGHDTMCDATQRDGKCWDVNCKDCPFDSEEALNEAIKIMEID